MAKRFQRRSLKMVDDDDGRTDDGLTPDQGHPISSPCEPNGSGELKIHTLAKFYPNRTKKLREICNLDGIVLSKLNPPMTHPGPTTFGVDRHLNTWEEYGDKQTNKQTLL